MKVGIKLTMSRIIRLSRLAVSSLFLITAASALSYAQTYTESVLYSPPSTSVEGNFYAPVVQASDGNLYGAFGLAGSTIIKVSISGMATPVYSLPSASDFTSASLMEGGDGNLYGMSQSSDASNGNAGFLYKISLNGTYSVFYTFCANPQATGYTCPDGETPFGKLVQGSDGNFYGTTTYGGANGFGAVFRITPSGNLTTLYSFCPAAAGVPTSGMICSDGSLPRAGLVQASDGNFYGTTFQGGALQSGEACTTLTGSSSYTGCGTIFQISPTGAFKVIYTFTAGSDGGFPSSTLVEGADGNLYGTTAAYPLPSGGYLPSEVFKIALDGTGLTSLLDLANSGSPGYGGGLFLASDGNLYTVDWSGGDAGCGAVDQITPSNAVNVIYSFPDPLLAGCSEANGHALSFPNGLNPYVAPVQGSDGNFYGTTYQGGAAGIGTIYKLAASPSLPPPVVLTLSNGSIQANESVTLN